MNMKTIIDTLDAGTDILRKDIEAAKSGDMQAAEQLRGSLAIFITICPASQIGVLFECVMDKVREKAMESIERRN